MVDGRRKQSCRKEEERERQGWQGPGDLESAIWKTVLRATVALRLASNQMRLQVDPRTTKLMHSTSTTDDIKNIKTRLCNASQRY